MFTKHPSQFLAKTDPRDQAQVKVAVENLKKWARGKLKKGTLREVAGRGGKIEQLEIEFAHRGYQDIFYLTRFELSLPPSRLNLPQPSPPVAKILADANFQLRNLQQSTPSQPGRKSSSETRREAFVEEEKPRPSTATREEKGKRMTMGVKDITWGKQEAVPKVPAAPTQPGPSSPPSPILYVPPRPPPPETNSLDSPLNTNTSNVDASGSGQYGAGVASTQPPGAGVASTSVPRAVHATPMPPSSMLDPSSAVKTPTKPASPGLLTPASVNDPMPITPTSARTSSLGWPHGSANFRVSQYQMALQPISPSPANGPRRGSEGQPHVPQELKVQQPHHRRPSAPFLATVPDPSAYHEETKEVLDDEPPRLPELPISKPSSADKGKQPAHKSQLSDPFVAKPEPGQVDIAAAKEAEMKRLLEEKIKALQTELESLEAAKLGSPVDTPSTLTSNPRSPPRSTVNPRSPPRSAVPSSQPSGHQRQPSSEARSPPRTTAPPSQPSGHRRQASSGGGIPPSIPLPPLPAPISTENRKPKPPPLTLQHTNMASSRPKPPSRSNSGLSPDEATSVVKIPSPLRASTVPGPPKGAPNASNAPPRPQRPPSAMIPLSMRNMENGQVSQSSGESYFSPKQPMSQSSSLAPSPTIISKASLEPVSVVQAQTHTVSVPTSAPMTRTPKSPPRGNWHDQAGTSLVAPKESKNGAPRLSILEPSPTFLADNWLSDLDSNLSSFDLDEPTPSVSLPSFPPPPGRADPKPPRSAPPTQTKMKISNPVPIDLDTDPRLVGKSRSALGSKSANSTPVIGFDVASTPNSYGSQGMPKSLQSFPPRAGPKHSPKSRSNSLPGDDEVPTPYGRSPNLTATYEVPKTATALQVQHALAQSSRQPVNAALAASPSSRLPTPTRRAPVPQTEPLQVALQGRAKVQTYVAPEPQKTNAEVAARRVQGYRQSISARYANKVQPQPQKPAVKVQPQIVRAEYGHGAEEEEGEGWVGFAV